MLAWVQKDEVPTMFGVEATWFRNDPLGRKYLRECLPYRKPKFDFLEHECHWGIPLKMSDSHPVPPPRAVCKCGYVAAV